MSSLEPLGLGLDLGTSGLRLVVVDQQQQPLHEQALEYPGPFRDPHSWRQGFITLAAAIPEDLKCKVAAIAIDGTSGTLVACTRRGVPLGDALAYCDAISEKTAAARNLVPDGGAAASASGSVARALQLLERHNWNGNPSDVPLLRHQADWLMGWLLGNWHWGEEGNNLRLGWDQEQQRWPEGIASAAWNQALPVISASGTRLGPLTKEAASALGLPQTTEVVCGTTDSNASVLAADPAPGDGVAVLGTTLVLKQFHSRPLHGPGISNHRLDGRWLVGGASNTGAGVLRQFFSDTQLVELSRQIDPQRPSGLQLRPLTCRGERFPIDDPQLEPVLGPRPISDALYLQALLEGLCAVEREGWKRLQELGAPPLQRVLSVGGGARNPQWSQLRRQALELQVLDRSRTSAATAMARLALRGATSNSS